MHNVRGIDSRDLVYRRLMVGVPSSNNAWLNALPASHKLEGLTVSGLSSGRTLCPSNRKRTVDSCFPCLSQKAFINFSSFVDLLILKKTSLLLSVTLMFKCSVAGGGASWPPFGECSFSDMLSMWRGVERSLGRWSLKQRLAQSLRCKSALFDFERAREQSVDGMIAECCKGD